MGLLVTLVVWMVLALAGGLAVGPAEADGFTPGPIPPMTPDIPPRTQPPAVAPGTFRPSWDLDDFYLWLGPSGAATTVDRAWDSTFGGDLAALRLREAAPLAAIGGELGFSKYTAHAGARLWLDALAGTRLGGRLLAGVTAGPMVEIQDQQRTHLGGSVGAWAFVGVTPYVRVGVLQQDGAFVEIGVRIALPVLRR